MPTITDESKLKKRNSAREIETHNSGAWVTIPAHRDFEKTPVLITPVIIFPTVYIAHQIPTFSFHLAEITISG